MPRSEPRLRRFGARNPRDTPPRGCKPLPHGRPLKPRGRRPLKVAGKPEIREYKAVFIVNDEEVGLASHELVVNCAP